MNNDEFPSRRQNDELEENADRGPLIKKILLWALGIIVLLIIAGAALFFYWASSAPKISRNELASQSTTTIYDANNKVISRLGAQKRQYAKSDEIPATLKHAVVSIEDRRFYKNHGVDPTRIFGAALNNVFHRSDGTQGGSTLTQQLVKLSVFSTAASDRTFKRKAQEAWLAINVDRNFSKNEILKFYINKVYMGNGVYGMKTAAQYYYGKSLNELSLAQMAMLAGIPQSPTYYNPAVSDTKAATIRRNQVLNAMVRSKYITQAQANNAKAESVTDGLDKSHGTTKSNDVNVKEPVIDAYVKEVLAQLEQKGYNPQTDGLQVHTNMDLGAQKKLYDSANNSVSFQSNQMQTGVAVTNPRNGQIVAMLGGRHTGNTVYGLNRAVQTNRSSGSTAKPLMDYGPAIEYLNWPTFYTLKDTKFIWPGTHTELHDFDNKTKGTMTMQDALVQSRNIPAIRALQKVGISRATTFLNGLGISQKKAFTLNNGIGLYVSPLQVSAAYAAFANGGTYYKPYYISSMTTQDGKTINYGKHGERAMSKATAYMITYMLKGVIDSTDGTGTAAHLSGVHQAGKTGTTNYPSGHSQSGVMDSWMAGYTKNYSIAVWTGYDQPMKNSISGSYEKSAILLYKAIMEYLDGKNHASDWRMPDSVEAVRYHGRKGLVVKDSKWALEYTAINDDSSSSSSSNSDERSSSSSNLSSSVSSYFDSSSHSSSAASSSSTAGNNNQNAGNTTDTSNTNQGGSTPPAQ
ncbi:transglycosylase domain-containing protein [uncultured Limosilactobacillus sp.]|uniref:transglycosylase domain-containing protein n=1 Tax=uncultured Limosilactobacillus sp. TaxID=2837629 RepID=UPI0025F739D6|nr:transglycosylase domain-containing protein [uncultured Limosilactobacillus sp.]